MEQNLTRAEKTYVGMKTAIRRIVATKRDIKSSLAVLTDANADLPRHREFEDRGVNPFAYKDGVEKWSSTAFNATPEDEWLVIKVPKANKTHFMCEFCDGDDLDNFEWFEGAFKQSLTIKDLLEYKNQRTREERRITNKMTQIRIFPSEPWERH